MQRNDMNYMLYCIERIYVLLRKEHPMKKLLATLLVGILMLSLAACGGEAAPGTTAPVETTESPKAGLQAGFAAASIVPNFNVGLQGFGNEAERIYTGSLKTYIYAHVLALTDASDNTVLVISVDAGSIGTWETTVRQEIQNEYGIPKNNILVHAIHQHSTPVMNGEYQKFCTTEVMKAVEKALADRAPAELLINTVQTEAMTFVRNYWMNDGTIWSPNYGDSSSGFKAHESEADSEVRLLKFQREGDKESILLVNFQGHPLMGADGNSGDIHGDWPEIMRDTVSEETGYHVMYISGAQGNLTGETQIAEEKVSTDWKHHGKRLADYVLGAEDSYTPVESGEIKVLSTNDSYETDHSMDHLVSIATAVNEVYQSQGLAAGKAEAAKYPELHSVYHATNILKKAATDPTIKVNLFAISIGDVVFATVPYEMFDTNGMELRNGTVGNENYAPEDQLENPYKMTIVSTLTNGHLGYVPSQLGYTNGGYATDITKLASGSGELIVGDLLHMINELHG